MKTKDLSSIALMTSILIILGIIPGIPLGIIPVPIVLQNLGVILAGLVLGTKRGTWSILLLLLLAALGLPVLSGGRGGFSVFLGPTAGYMFGWVLTPLLTNWGLSLLKDNKRFLLQFIMTWCAAVLTTVLIGTLWLTWQNNMSFTTALLSNIVFLPGDTLKVLLSLLLAKALKSQSFSQNALL